MQCRAARAALRLSIPELAKIARLGERSIGQFESEGRATSNGTKAALRLAFADLGVSFTISGGLEFSDAAEAFAAKQLGEGGERGQ
jgi:transcriptional regulator with XRE-family HTH domain